MIDPERLKRTALGLAEAIANPGPDGRVHLPVVSQNDAVGLVAMTHAQLDEAIARRTAAAAEQDLPIACREGCTACCTMPLVVTEAESLAVVVWLRNQPTARAHFEAAYPAWRATLGDLVDSAGAWSTAEESHAWCVAAARRRAMCAFNRDGSCTIYEVRPSLCRKAHALYTNAKCGEGDGQVDYFEHAETEQEYASQSTLHGALHHALRPGKPHELLCEAVHRRLAPTGRNAPCPCGSGKKFKRCCGDDAR